MAPAPVSRLLRLLHGLALILPTLAAVYLLSTHSHLYGDSTVGFVRSYRPTLQLVVQIVSHFLSMLQIYTLCSLFNFATRLKLNHQEPIPLAKLGLWSALSNVRIGWAPPYHYLLLTVVAALLSVAPGALWAGALTPIVVLGRSRTDRLQLPAYSQSSAAHWDSEFGLDAQLNVWNLIGSCTQIHDRRGLVPSCPVPGLQGSLLLSASTATTIDSRPRLHSKLDNSQWSYSGRSFGVGSSAGLSIPSFGLDSASSLIPTFQYSESGYDAQVSCIKNRSSEIIINLEEQCGKDAITYYTLQGRLPNEPPELQPEFYPLTVFNSDYADIPSMLVAGSAGGCAVAEAVSQWRSQRGMGRVAILHSEKLTFGCAIARSRHCHRCDRMETHVWSQSMNLLARSEELPEPYRESLLRRAMCALQMASTERPSEILYRA